MAKTKVVGHGFDGPYRFTLGIVLGLLMVVIGAVLIGYVGSFLLGVPLLLLGLALPVVLEFLIAKKA